MKESSKIKLNKNKKLFSFDFYESKKQTFPEFETNLSYSILTNYSTSIKQSKLQTWKTDDTGFPKMGEVGCGSLYPTCSLLIITMPLMLGFFSDLERPSMQSGERRMKKGELGVFFGAWNFKFSSALPLNLSWKVKQWIRQ